MSKQVFAKEVEKLIDPISVGSLHLLQSFNQLLPKSIQKKVVRSSSKKTPHMGFVVEPYSTFLCYEIADIKQAKKLIPDSFELLKTKIFADDEPKYYCIFGCVRAHTSAFWGFRTEFYIIAEDKKTKLLSWLIIDYDTNTISYDDKNGLSSPNSSQSIMTINHRGDLYVEIKRNDKSNELIFNTNVETGKMKNLDQRLWLEGNLSIGYGRDLSASETAAGIFSLKFEPLEVEKALKIPGNSLKLESNTWYPRLFKKEPSQIVCFPYAQHFISDSPGFSSNIKNKEELVAATKELDFTNMKVFSTKSFKVMFVIGSILSSLITITFFLLWLNK